MQNVVAAGAVREAAGEASGGQDVAHRAWSRAGRSSPEAWAAGRGGERGGAARMDGGGWRC